MMRVVRTLSLYLTAGLSLASCGGSEHAAPDNTPASITVTPNAPQTLASGGSATFTADVRNRTGASLSGVSVTWSSSDATVASIDQTGKLAAAKVGTASVTASVASLSSAAVVVTITPGAPAQLAIRIQPAGAVSTVALVTQPVVEIRDQAGNVVTGSSLTVTASVNSGSGTLSGTVAVAAVAGVATFSDLVLTGSGSIALSFAAPSMTGVTATAVTIAQGPKISLSSTAASLAAWGGGSAAISTITITNGGTVSLRGLSVGAVTYAANQPTGWLLASVNSATAPATLTLTASPAALPVGTYAASVGVSATGASNSPQTLSVTFTVYAAPASLGYTTTAGQTLLLAPGATATSASTVIDSAGATISGGPVTYVSRAPRVAAVDATGVITGVAEGATWVIAQVSPTVADSVWLNVTKPTGPIVFTTLSKTTWKAGDTISVTVVLDTRTTTVGAANILVTWSGDLTKNSTGVATLYDVPFVSSDVVGTGSPELDLIRLTAVRSNGFTGRIELVTFRLLARTDLGPTGGAGWVFVVPQDVVGLDQSPMMGQTTSTHYPLIVK